MGTETVREPEVPLSTVRDSPGQTASREEAFGLTERQTTTRSETG